MSSDPQVRLVPATVPLLKALNEDPRMFGELIGSPVPDSWPEFPAAVGFTLEHLQTAPQADHSWSMQFFVDPATSCLVGSGGFAAAPVERTVEIGYEVAPEFRGQGFGTAAARALVERAVATGVDGRSRVAGLRAPCRRGGPRCRHCLGVEVDAADGELAARMGV